MPSNRMSSLPIAQFCGRAPELSSVGSGRAAAMSHAFHALCAGGPEAAGELVRLTDEERAEVRSWKRPVDVTVGDVVLTYEAAEKELEVGLDSSGAYCPADYPACVTVGHLDFAWCFEVDGQRYAFVADIKRSEYTVSDGPDSLQLHAYGLAYASKVGAVAYVTGVWGAVEGTWWWANAQVMVDSFDHLDILQRVLAAARNTSQDYAMGPHCQRCYGRSRCPAYLIAPSDAHAELAPVIGLGTDLTPEYASKLLLTVFRVEAMAEKVKDELKQRVRDGLVITDGNGKAWKPTECQGRESLSKRLLEKAGLNPADYTERGKPYERWGWQKR